MIISKDILSKFSTNSSRRDALKKMEIADFFRSKLKLRL